MLEHDGNFRGQKGYCFKWPNGYAKVVISWLSIDYILEEINTGGRVYGYGHSVYGSGRGLMIGKLEK